MNKQILIVLLIFVLIILVYKINEPFINYSSLIDVNVKNIYNKVINCDNRINVNKTIQIGNRIITKDDIIALKSLPLVFDNQMCIGDECVIPKDFKNLKQFWNYGTIIAFSGEIKDIPENWAICDGTNSTPDLREKFIIGAGKTYKLNDQGGKKKHILDFTEMAEHSHTFNVPLQENSTVNKESEPNEGSDDSDDSDESKGAFFKKKIYPSKVGINIRGGNGYFIGPTGYQCSDYENCSSQNGGGKNYRGKQNISIGNHKCQQWDQDSPHSHSRKPDNPKYKGYGLGSHNYCRNPDGEIGPWCYTIGGKRWELCHTSPTPSNKTEPHNNMPAYYRVIFIMRIINKPDIIETTTSSPKPKPLSDYEKLIKQIRDVKQIPIA